MPGRGARTQGSTWVRPGPPVETVPTVNSALAPGLYREQPVINSLMETVYSEL